MMKHMKSKRQRSPPTSPNKSEPEQQQGAHNIAQEMAAGNVTSSATTVKSSKGSGRKSAKNNGNAKIDRQQQQLLEEINAAVGQESCDDATRMTCDALCSLSTNSKNDDGAQSRSQRRGCPKQHQLPMFLSKTYHMIDKCDGSIASWSDDGQSFVVKTTELFASSILPKYFKHSNFSSFARQLNFYGFRKLKAEPILTADFDAQTAGYVRFYHEKFQKDRPDLLTQIRRATKSDQQSKDELESLKVEMSKLKETLASMSQDFERRMSDMSYEYNRRITSLSAEYDKLAALVRQLLVSQQGAAAAKSSLAAAVGAPTATDMMHSLSQVAAMTLQNPLAAAVAASVSMSAGTKRSLSDPSAENGGPSVKPRLGDF